MNLRILWSCFAVHSAPLKIWKKLGAEEEEEAVLLPSRKPLPETFLMIASAIWKLILSILKNALVVSLSHFWFLLSNNSS
ncbi:wsv337 [White spot syndrome virus]|uniref:Wsv337 n=4 Tax=White spot syndrome virus TaxID=342409 RepID=Q8VAR0_WSSVS|nr:wsv337 [Shrimp white spot syndrome virus]AFX59714.1 wsv337 [White spot syndrome virus]AAL33339.1 wsv337 [Shrimp white spot syndrome virus]AAL89261.1 WSSV393 [Shrimp white spot syndrome virus]AWQ60467.1 wsv337 [Shrimp white spot syndrome virus]AWQ60910.1 wsv337 [Shrimp white spot syndrome virus]